MHLIKDQFKQLIYFDGTKSRSSGLQKYVIPAAHYNEDSEWFWHTNYVAVYICMRHMAA